MASQIQEKGKAELKFYADTEKIFTDTHVKLENIADSKRKSRARANWIKLTEKSRIPADRPNAVQYKYTNPRVKFDRIHWWISVGIESEPNIMSLSPNGIGIDVGAKDLAILSVEKQTKYRNINKTEKVRKFKKKQRRLQRKISRKYRKNKKGESYCKTNNIIKIEKQLLKINQRLTGIRHNHVHYATSEIIKQKPRFIVIEDLNVQRYDEKQTFIESSSGSMFI